MHPAVVLHPIHPCGRVPHNPLLHFLHPHHPVALSPASLGVPHTLLLHLWGSPITSLLHPLQLYHPVLHPLHPSPRCSISYILGVPHIQWAHPTPAYDLPLDPVPLCPHATLFVPIQVGDQTGQGAPAHPRTPTQRLSPRWCGQPCGISYASCRMRSGSGYTPSSPSLPFVPKKSLSHTIFSPQEELRVQVSSLGQQLAEAEEERDNASARVQQLQKLMAESEEGDGGIFGMYPPQLVGFRVICPMLEPHRRVGAFGETEARGR